MSHGAVARALVLEAPHHLVVREFAVPTVGDDDALVRVVACGLCGTDHEQHTGELAGGFAFVPGHETVGTIEAIGPRAARRWGVAQGDRVAVEVFQSCRECKSCLAGEYRRCVRHGLADMYGFIPLDREPGLRAGSNEDARRRLDKTFDSGDSELLRYFRELADDHLEVIAGDKGEANLDWTSGPGSGWPTPST